MRTPQQDRLAHDEDSNQMILPRPDAPDVVVVLSYFGLDDTLTCVASLVAGSPSASP